MGCCRLVAGCFAAEAAGRGGAIDFLTGSKNDCAELNSAHSNGWSPTVLLGLRPLHFHFISRNSFIFYSIDSDFEMIQPVGIFASASDSFHYSFVCNVSINCRTFIEWYFRCGFRSGNQQPIHLWLHSPRHNGDINESINQHSSTLISQPNPTRRKRFPVKEKFIRQSQPQYELPANTGEFEFNSIIKIII